MGLRIGASFSTRGECYNVDVIRNAIRGRERDESMTSHWQDWPPQVLAALRKGVVIPAHPLASSDCVANDIDVITFAARGERRANP